MQTMQQLVVESMAAAPGRATSGPQTIPPATATALGEPPHEPVFVVTNDAVECLKLRTHAHALATADHFSVAKRDMADGVAPAVRACARANRGIPTYVWVDDDAEWLYLCQLVVTEETDGTFLLRRKWWAP